MPDVCVIAPSSLRYVPYLRYYEEVLAQLGIRHDLFLWDRYGTGETRPGAFAYRRPGTARGLALLPAYAGYRRFLLKELKRRSHRAYVILGSQVGVLLYDFLRNRPFLLDIRDYSHEGMLPYSALVFDLVRRARLVSISSRGFLEWLPGGVDYNLSHNVGLADLDAERKPFDRTKVVLSSIGATGYLESHVRFLDGVRLHPGWQVRFIGKGTCEGELEAHCRSRGISNVTFRGAFAPEEKATFYAETNFVLGIYAEDSLVGRTLTPNRLYEACLRRRPLLVNAGTHLASMVEARGLGVAVDLREPSGWAARLAPYFEPSYYAEYDERCSDFLREVASDVQGFARRVRGALSSAGVAC